MEEQAFIAKASHDIKSLLTSVKAYVQLLHRQLVKTEDDKAIRYAEKIDSQINKVTRMMSDLVDVYRIKAGKLELYKETLAIDGLLAEIIENMQTTTTTHSISLEGKTAAYASIDKVRLSQAIGNILHNAIIYSPDAPTIAVNLHKETDKIAISVEDFGVGIPKEKIAVIFDPFLQERTQGALGLGAGVFIASSIIKSHGGELTIESNVGKGTKVYIRLPINKKK